MNINNCKIIAPILSLWKNNVTPGLNFGLWIIERGLFMCSAFVSADGV